MDFRLVYLSLTHHGTCISPFRAVITFEEKKKSSLCRRSVPGVQHILSLSVSLSLSRSHDIRNYSALAWTEPARLGVLLPRRWVSDSNRGKLAVTEAGGSGAAAMPQRRSSFAGHLLTAKADTRQQVITAARNANKAQYSRGQMGFFLHVRMNSHRRNVYGELQRGRCETECCSAALSHRKLQEWAFFFVSV